KKLLQHNPRVSGHRQTSRSGPKTCTLAEVTASFDCLVGAGEKWRWYFEPESTGSLCIDDELEFRGLTERNFSGVLADRR
ncbi:hypothetical protein, partial [Bradyrhizobium sp. CSA112]|uniref:hypothetical protein n=1 Tax=Bradyrhizobium sp. CSA112 TaxID=2699170 RepID=UPI0023B128E6